MVSGVQLGEEEGGGLPCPFLKIKKNALTLQKKTLTVSIFRLHLRVSRRKTSEIFPAGPIFLEFLMKCLLKCLNFMKLPLP